MKQYSTNARAWGCSAGAAKRVRRSEEMQNTAHHLTIRAMKLALTIAGSDPTGGAGLQLDLRVFQSLGVHGLSTATALTIQDTEKVHQSLPVFPSLVLDQTKHDDVFTLTLPASLDLRPDAIKLGMLASDDVARQVALALGELRERPPLVIDPILHSSSGHPLLERRAWATLISLCEGAALVTPNLPEAEALTGLDVSSEEGVTRAARTFIEEMGATAVLIKGGHRDAAPDDLLAARAPDGIVTTWLRSERIEGPSVHGTGCALSAAITAELAKGAPLSDAIETARTFLLHAYRNAFAAGRGARLLAIP